MEGSSQMSLYQSLISLLGQFLEDPRVACLLNSRLGQYLRQHPVLGVTVVVFSSLAALPVGLFVTFALVTLVISAVGFVLVEVCLLLAAGLTLLLTLSGLAFFSAGASLIFGTFYMTFTNLYGGCNQHGATTKEDEEE